MKKLLKTGILITATIAIIFGYHYYCVHSTLEAMKNVKTEISINYITNSVTFDVPDDYQKVSNVLGLGMSATELINNIGIVSLRLQAKLDHDLYAMLIPYTLGK